MPLRKIISGGQTGADQAGLAAGVELKLETGGMMPKGFKTEDGPRPRFARLYGVQEHEAPEYPPRTKWNIENSDGTLLFGRIAREHGSALTHKTCEIVGKPCKLVEWDHRWGRPGFPSDKNWIRDIQVEMFRKWLGDLNIEVLNVAGNRESTNPGIYQACYEFLMDSLA